MKIYIHWSYVGHNNQLRKKNMPLPTLIQSCFSTLLDDIVISDATAQKAISLFKEHFTFTADEITKAYQDSYGYAITAISVGLAAPDQKLAFVQKLNVPLLRFAIPKLPENLLIPLKSTISNPSPNSAAAKLCYANN